MTRINKIEEPSRWVLRVLMMGMFGLTGCETVVNVETGAQCSDGKDNDADGLIDCADSGCDDTFICSRTVDGGSPPDSAPDSSPPDSAPDASSPDMTLEPDHATSSYLQLCNNPGQPCSDGKTICIILNQTGSGYCSPPCNQGESCPSGSVEQAKTLCNLNFNQDWYCLFYCQLGNETYPCPQGFQCLSTSNPSAKLCFP